MALRELPLLLKYTHNHVGMPTRAHLRTCKHTHVRVHTCPHMHTCTHTHTHTERSTIPGEAGRYRRIQFPQFHAQCCFQPPGGQQTQMSPEAYQVSSPVQMDPGCKGKGQGGGGLLPASPPITFQHRTPRTPRSLSLNLTFPLCTKVCLSG